MKHEAFYFLILDFVYTTASDDGQCARFHQGLGEIRAEWGRDPHTQSPSLKGRGDSLPTSALTLYLTDLSFCDSDFSPSIA